MASSQKKAIVTLIVGDDYERMWTTHLADGWTAYGQRHGYDVFAVRKPIRPDPFARSVNWQKLLLCSHPRFADYDRLVWVDSDIAIHAELAPSIVEDVPEERIGAVLYGDLQEPELRDLVQARWLEAFRALRGVDNTGFWESYYSREGLEAPSEPRFNTGVLVITPRLHRPFLENLFARHPRDAFDKEQTFLNHALLTDDLVHPLDPRFNRELGYEFLKHYPFLFLFDRDRARLRTSPGFDQLAASCLTALWERCFFLHFPGVRWPAELWHKLVRGQPSPDWRRVLAGLLTPPPAAEGLSLAHGAPKDLDPFESASRAKRGAQ
jgi:hypothetical protein